MIANIKLLRKNSREAQQVTKYKLNKVQQFDIQRLCIYGLHGAIQMLLLLL